MIGGIEADKWERMMNGSVPDSLRAKRALIVEMHKKYCRPSVFESLREGLLWSASNGACPKNWGPEDHERDFLEYQFAYTWHQHGCVTYSLTHSMAAMLSVTRSPPITGEHLPHGAFLVEVPAPFLPLVSDRDAKNRWIGIARTPAIGADGKSVDCTVIMTVADSDMLADFVFCPDGHNLDEADKVLRKDEAYAEHAGLTRVAVRLASNTIAYVTSHRENIRRISSFSSSPSFEVRPPKDVIIDRSFRDAAIGMVAARDFKSRYSALSHVVRGHWRNQPVGEGRKERKLTWVRPHKRGDESLGRVVQRIERLRAPQ